MAIHTKQASVDVGGLYGMNVEALTGDETRTAGTDEIYQYLNPNGASRVITLSLTGAVAGDRFVVRNTDTFSSTRYLSIKSGTTEIDRLYAGAIGKYIFNGTKWVALAIGTGEEDTKRNNVVIGFQGRAYDRGVAVGSEARGNTYGAGVGYMADGEFYGVALGYSAVGNSYGIAIGRNANTSAKKYSIALGYYSKGIRTAETSINIDGGTSQKNNVVQGRWAKTTTNNTPVEIFLGAEANQRFTIRPSSVLAFKMIITARDNVAGEVAMYTVVDGLIKRDAANNTVLVNCTVTTVHEDDAGWDVAVTADDGNEALIITVTGDAANPVQWVAVLDGVETHF